MRSCHTNPREGQLIALERSSGHVFRTFPAYFPGQVKISKSKPNFNSLLLCRLFGKFLVGMYLPHWISGQRGQQWAYRKNLRRRNTSNFFPKILHTTNPLLMVCSRCLDQKTSSIGFVSINKHIHSTPISLYLLPKVTALHPSIARSLQQSAWASTIFLWERGLSPVLQGPLILARQLTTIILWYLAVPRV